MKSVCAVSVLALLTLYSFVAHAVPDDELKVYTAMPGYGVEVKINGPKALQKEIGGLRCRELKTFTSLDESRYLLGYECDLSRRNRDDAAIYNAIQIAAVRDRSSSAKAIVDVKHVGNLTCRRSEEIATGRVQHACKLKTSWFF